MSLSNKVVVVTGAGGGIGKAIAKHFAKSQANLTLLDINEETLNKIAEQCEKLEARVLKIVTNVTIDEDLKRAVDFTLREFGKIDVLINCAGVTGSGSIINVDLMKTFDRTLRTNLRSMIAMTNYTVDELIKTKGCIINISSVLSKMVFVRGISYSVVKAGVTSFTKSIAMKLAEDGVRVNCISPGPVKTNIWPSKSNTDDDEKLWEGINKLSPLKEPITIEDIAELVFFLASDKAKSITGSDFVIDAGISLLGWGNQISQYLDSKFNI